MNPTSGFSCPLLGTYDPFIMHGVGSGGTSSKATHTLSFTENTWKPTLTQTLNTHNYYINLGNVSYKRIARVAGYNNTAQLADGNRNTPHAVPGIHKGPFYTALHSSPILYMLGVLYMFRF